MVVAREVRKDEFEADFEDDESDAEAEVGFDVDVPSEVNHDRSEDGEGDEHIVHGFCAGGREDFGAVAFAAAIEASGEGKFGGDGAEEDDDREDGVFGGGGGFAEFFESLDNDVDASSEDDESNEDGGGAFDFSAVFGVARFLVEFLADDNNEARGSVD